MIIAYFKIYLVNLISVGNSLHAKLKRHQVDRHRSSLIKLLIISVERPQKYCVLWRTRRLLSYYKGGFYSMCLSFNILQQYFQVFWNLSNDNVSYPFFLLNEKRHNMKAIKTLYLPREKEKSLWTCFSSVLYGDYSNLLILQTNQTCL